MSQNSFIKQYLEKQQELLRQRLEREAREAAELEGKPTVTSNRSLVSVTGRQTGLTNGRSKLGETVVHLLSVFSDAR